MPFMIRFNQKALVRGQKHTLDLCFNANNTNVNNSHQVSPQFFMFAKLSSSQTSTKEESIY